MKYRKWERLGKQVMDGDIISRHHLYEALSMLGPEALCQLESMRHSYFVRVEPAETKENVSDCYANTTSCVFCVPNEVNSPS